MQILHIDGNLLSPRKRDKKSKMNANVGARIESSLGWMLYANVGPLNKIYLVMCNISKSMFLLSIENWLSCINKETGNKRR